MKIGNEKEISSLTENIEKIKNGELISKNEITNLKSDLTILESELTKLQNSNELLKNFNINLKTEIEFLKFRTSEKN